MDIIVIDSLSPISPLHLNNIRGGWYLNNNILLLLLNNMWCYVKWLISYNKVNYMDTSNQLQQKSTFLDNFLSSYVAKLKNWSKEQKYSFSW